MSALLKIVKIVVFCSLFSAILYCLDALFVPKNLEGRWDTVKSANSYYDLDKNSVDILFIGSSGIASAVDPYQLYEEYGMSAYNLGMASQTADGTYYWLKEFFSTQNPKTVVMDAKTFGRFERALEPLARKSFDAMRWSPAKIAYSNYYYEKYFDDKEELEQEREEAREEALKNGKKFDEEDYDESRLADYHDYYFPLNTYHSRWSSLIEYDFTYAFGAPESKSLSRGYMMMDKQSGIDYKGISFEYENTEEYDYDENAREYLAKITDLCKENGAQLILMKTPDSEWTDRRHAYVQEIAGQNGVPYLDINETKQLEEIGFDYKTDASDYMHINVFGAVKITKVVGEFLSQNYDYTDYRKETGPLHDELEEGLKIYKYELAGANLRMINNLDEYLATIDADQYSYMIVTGGEFEGVFTDNQKKLFENLGFENKMIESINEKTNILAVIDGNNRYFKSEEIEDENGSALSISKESKLNSGAVYKLTSMESGAQIKIGSNNEIVRDKNKVYLVVYDNVTGHVSDSIYFDVNDSNEVILKRYY